MNAQVKNRLKKWGLSTILLCVLMACNKNDDETPPPPEPEVTKTISDLLEESSSLTVINAIIKAVDEKNGGSLGTTLNSDGAFTLFAPINDSDTPLLIQIDEQGNLIISDEDAPLWDQIIRYHLVADAALEEADLSNGRELTTVLSEKLRVSTEGGLFLADATENNTKIVQTDIVAKNGIVHYVDRVLVPQTVLAAIAQPDVSNGIEEALEADPDLKSFLEAIRFLDLEEEFFTLDNGTGKGIGSKKTENATIFAPNNDAFESLFAELGDAYNSLEDFDTETEKDLLRNAMRYHTVPGGKRLANSFQDGETLNTEINEDITIGTQTSDVQVRDRKSAGFILNPDQEVGTNVIHTINIVLRPIAFYDGFEADPTSGDTRNMIAVFNTYPSLSILVAAIEKTNLSFVYPRNNFTEPPVNISTYFAPDNEAFEALFETLGENYNSLDDFDTAEKLEILADILLHQHSSSYLCSETLIASGRSQVYLSRLINPQVPKFPDYRNEVVTIGDATEPVITIRDDIGREARIKQADITVGKNIPACAEGVTDLGGNTSLVHITNLVLLKRDFSVLLNDL